MSEESLNGVQQTLDQEYEGQPLEVEERVRLKILSDGTRAGTYVTDQDGRIVDGFVGFDYEGGGSGNPMIVLRLAAPDVEIRHEFKPIPVSGPITSLEDLVRDSQERALALAAGHLPKDEIVLEERKDCVIPVETMTYFKGAQEVAS